VDDLSLRSRLSGLEGMTTGKPVLVIMAKQPAVGRTKTRLCPPLTPAEAVALYKAMLQDTIGLVADVEGVRLAIAVTPPEATDSFRPISPPDVILLGVAGADIGDCLSQVLGRLLADGHSQAIALNSDGPTLPAAYLRPAIARLDDADVVLGPSEDGGYYLIGLTQPQPELFQDIEWSTEQVTAQTVARAEAMGLSVALLPPWYDVDTSADLDRLRAELTTLPAEALPHTRRFFAHHLQESSPGCSNWSARIEAASAEVERRLTGLPDDAWLDVVEGTWTAKDLIGHLAAWSDLLLDEVEALARGDADAIRTVDIADWNAVQIATRRGWPVEKVRAVWKATVRRALRVATRMSADAVTRHWHVVWTEEPVSPADLLDLWLVHIEQHRESLITWRDRNSERGANHR
jgi:rSAM/selenodomain-associated transferase 1